MLDKIKYEYPKFDMLEFLETLHFLVKNRTAPDWLHQERNHFISVAESGDVEIPAYQKIMFMFDNLDADIDEAFTNILKEFEDKMDILVTNKNNERLKLISKYCNRDVLNPWDFLREENGYLVPSGNISPNDRSYQDDDDDWFYDEVFDDTFVDSFDDADIDEMDDIDFPFDKDEFWTVDEDKDDRD